MLDANTLQWLEGRDALQFMFDQYTLPYGEVSFDDDIRDAAEFEARVAKKLCDHFWNYAIAERYFELALPYRRLPADFVLKHARLDVEAEMIAEGKGPGGSMNEDKKCKLRELSHFFALRSK